MTLLLKIFFLVIWTKGKHKWVSSIHGIQQKGKERTMIDVFSESPTTLARTHKHRKKRQRKRENVVRDSPMDNYHYQDKRTIDMLSSIDTARALIYSIILPFEVIISRCRLPWRNPLDLRFTWPVKKHMSEWNQLPFSTTDRQSWSILSLSSTSRIDCKFLESINLTS